MRAIMLRASASRLLCACHAAKVFGATAGDGLSRPLAMPLGWHALHNMKRSMSSRSAVLCMRSDSDTPRSPVVATLKETAALDQMIDLLLAAKSPQQLAQLVAENILSCDQKFWLRMATRSDTAANREEKERLGVLADKVMTLVDRIVKQTEMQLSDSAELLQDILKAAADDKGEWYLPLGREQVDRMRGVMERQQERLDEAFLSNAFAYMRKASDDGLDGMVTLLRKVLQLYAARTLGRGAEEGPEALVNEVIRSEEEEWVGLIQSQAAAGGISEVLFMEVLQRKMESTVLALKSGSYSQLVQAEYLKELEGRAKSVFKELSQKS